MGTQCGLTLAEQCRDGLGQLMSNAGCHLPHAVDARGMGQLCLIGQLTGLLLMLLALLAAAPDQIHRRHQRRTDQQHAPVQRLEQALRASQQLHMQRLVVAIQGELCKWLTLSEGGGRLQQALLLELYAQAHLGGQGVGIQ